MRYLPPAGTPIRSGDLSAWLSTVLNSSKTLQNFRQKVCEHFGVKYAFFLSTGRAAMVVLLQVLRENSTKNKDQVIIPSYTCFSVPAAIIKAGLEIRVCDVNPCTFDYDYDKLSRFDFSRVLCIVSANLYGIPNDLRRMEGLATEHGVYLIDDAAQSMGARVAGQESGTFGDAGIFSLDKGKAITSMNGGIVITNSDRLAGALNLKIKNLSPPSSLWVLSEAVKMVSYAIFLDPSRYWIPARLPFLNLGTTVYTTDYPVSKYNKLLSGMALQLFRQLDELNRIRTANAHYYVEKLSEIQWIQFVTIKDDIYPVYLRFPILVPEQEHRSRIEENLTRLGLGVSRSYPAAVVDIKELYPALLKHDIEACGGRAIAKQILTLPTHPYVTNKDLATIVAVITNQEGT